MVSYLLNSFTIPPKKTKVRHVPTHHLRWIDPGRGTWVRFPTIAPTWVGKYMEWWNHNGSWYWCSLHPSSFISLYLYNVEIYRYGIIRKAFLQVSIHGLLRLLPTFFCIEAIFSKRDQSFHQSWSPVHHHYFRCTQQWRTPWRISPSNGLSFRLSLNLVGIFGTHVFLDHSTGSLWGLPVCQVCPHHRWWKLSCHLFRSHLKATETLKGWKSW